MKHLRSIFTALLLVTIMIGATDADAQRYPSRFIKDKVNHIELMWTIGEGLATDTTKLSTSADYGTIFYGDSETLLLEKLTCSMKPAAVTSTDTLSVQVCWSDTIADATPTKINTADLVVTDTLLGTADIVFDNETIASGSFIWVELGDITTGRKPTQVVVTLEATKQD